jgi:uncharacterized membrane protein
VVAEPTHKQNGGKMKTRYVVYSSIIAALYFVFTIGLAPLSFGPIQFRISEILKVFVLFNPFLAIGIGIGTFFANLMSPYAGPMELIWMPFTDMAGGLLAWALYHYVLRSRFPMISMGLYAITTGFAVGLMLAVIGVGFFWESTISVAISEMIILIAGTPIMLWIVKMLAARGVDLGLESQQGPVTQL